MSIITVGRENLGCKFQLPPVLWGSQSKDMLDNSANTNFPIYFHQVGVVFWYKKKLYLRSHR